MSARRAAFSCNREISVLTVPSKREPDQPSKDKLLDKRRQAVPRGNRPSQQLKFHQLHRPLHLIPGQASAVQRHLAELVVIAVIKVEDTNIRDIDIGLCIAEKFDLLLHNQCIVQGQLHKYRLLKYILQGN